MTAIYRIIALLFIASLSVAQSNDNIILDDNFSGLRSMPLSNNTGAHTEYQYMSEAAPKCDWVVSNDKGWWTVRSNDRGKFIYQSKFDKDLYAHPAIITGDDFWQDYTVTASFEPESEDYLCGVMFRYNNDLCYYFFGLQEGNVVLKKAEYQTGFHQPNEKILASDKFKWKKGEILTAEISVNGSDIIAKLSNGIELRATDPTFSKGKIGFLSGVPARFHSARVTMNDDARSKFLTARKNFDQIEKDLQASNPKPVLWKKINTEGFGVGRNIRFGDLDNDGVTDVLIGQVVHHGPKDRNSELSCMTAMTFDGKKLWQIGEPDLWKDNLTNDCAFQIYDIDRDGKNDVIYCKDFELIVADGATGKTKYKTSTPDNPGPKPTSEGNNKYDKILGDCIYICDLSGNGYPSDIVIKDRYTHLWAYNNKLELLWNASCNTGHYPYTYDMDGDGKDELLMGFTMFDDNGKVLWSLDNQMHDHADGVAIVKFKENEEPKILCAASDEGFMLIDLKGNILEHLFLGHVQNPAIANFRDDLPGLEAVTINFWRNQGVIHFFDSGGDIYHSFEPNQYGSMCLPVNWTGRTEEFFVHNTNVEEGAMYDGWGRKAVIFPDDGHPDMCNAVLDITGDCRDEVVVWNPNEIWVYTQSDNPKTGKLYKPRRNPLYNYSNYQATVSQ